LSKDLKEKDLDVWKSKQEVEQVKAELTEIKEQFKKFTSATFLKK